MDTKQTTGIIYVLAGFVFIAGIVLLMWFGFGWRPTVSEPFAREDEVVVEECDFVRYIDGICVEHEKDIDPELVAVMVENHVDARPQSGLSAARIVYEAPVEANYSRFMLIYPLGEDVMKVGPVRSARPYYLDWLAEYGDQIMYMHVGGSPDALSLITTRDIFDLNEFYRGWYYWRGADRYAPHNVYTSSKLWEKAYDEYGPESEEEGVQGEGETRWLYKKMDACEEACVTHIDVVFLPPTYVAEWEYSTSTQQYGRYQMGYPHVDQDGTQIMADTIIVQYVETEVLDAIGRLGMDTIGSGELQVFRNGHMIEGTWNKEDVESKTQWLDAEGNDIALQAGKIWIEVVNQRGDVTFE